jgi:hypothetical protein
MENSYDIPERFKSVTEPRPGSILSERFVSITESKPISQKDNRYYPSRIQ